MRCEEVRPLIHSYLDGELDLVRSTEIDRHFDICHVCTRVHQGGLELRFAIREEIPYFTAPPELAQRVRLMAQEQRAKESKTGFTVPRDGWRRARPLRWRRAISGSDRVGALARAVIGARNHLGTCSFPHGGPLNRHGLDRL